MPRLTVFGLHDGMALHNLVTVVDRIKQSL